MKYYFAFFFHLLLFYNFGQTNSSTATKYLSTGWYYITTVDKGIPKNLFKKNEIFYIDSTPIITVKNFTDLSIYKDNTGIFGLQIKLDKKGTKAWSIATENSIGKKLALIIDDELYHTPYVNNQINVGISALNRGDLTEDELNKIKIRLEKEKK
jgi:preprotein translocase subunit SecD